MLAKRKSPTNAKTRRAPNSRAGSLASKAYELIRNEILQGSLAVGDILSRRRLADKLNMSFLPITEALQRLEAQGLVESRPRIGTRVRIPTREDILDSYVIREALETQAARLCCEQMTTVQQEQLLKRARRLDKLYSASATREHDSRFLFTVHTHHMQFHMHIAEVARSPRLLVAIEREQVLVLNWLYDTAARQKSLPANFHYDLATALCSGEVATADMAMRNHIRYGLDYVVENLKTLEVSKPWRLKWHFRSRSVSRNGRGN